LKLFITRHGNQLREREREREREWKKYKKTTEAKPERSWAHASLGDF
jgi:hypothetical protein